MRQPRPSPKLKRRTKPDPAALTEVRAIYDELARRPVERHCVSQATCCHFRLTGKVPYLTRGEALVLAAG